MTFTFARVGAAAGKMRVEDVYVQGRRTWVPTPRERGQTPRNAVPSQVGGRSAQVHRSHSHAAANTQGGAVDPKGWLFPTTEGQSGTLTGRSMSQPDVYRMIGRRKYFRAARPAVIVGVGDQNRRGKQDLRYSGTSGRAI